MSSSSRIVWPAYVRRLRALLLLAGATARCASDIPIAFLNEDISESCFRGDDEQYSFFNCCHGLYDMLHLQRVLSRQLPLTGNVQCWSGDYTYERCCSWNANRSPTPRHDVAFWPFHLPDHGDGRVTVTAVQGAVLDHFAETYDFRDLPFRDLHKNGAGLIWGGGFAALALAHIRFGFPVDPSRKFLHLASAVGAPSLVALARGFAVWSADLHAASGWQRRAGASVSFGAPSAELWRLRTPVVDLLNASTWPRERFDAVLLEHVTGPDPVRQRHIDQTDFCQKICTGFRTLLHAQLASSGVGLYVRRAPGKGKSHDVRTWNDGVCALPDQSHAVAVHQQNSDGSWRSWWSSDSVLDIEETAPNGMYLVFSIHARTGLTSS